MPKEIVTPNLIQSDPDTVMEKLGKDFVTSDEIKTIVGKYRQPEYRAILREPLPEKRIIEMCGDMVQYRGHWIMRNSQPAKWRIDRILDQKK